MPANSQAPRATQRTNDAACTTTNRTRLLVALCDPQQNPADHQGGNDGDDEVAQESLHLWRPTARTFSEGSIVPTSDRRGMRHEDERR